MGKPSCTLNWLSDYWKLNNECQQVATSRIDASVAGSSPNADIPEPILFIVSECIADGIINPLTDTKMTKMEMGLIVVFIDMIMIVLFLIFIELLENSQRAYVQKFND